MCLTYFLLSRLFGGQKYNQVVSWLQASDHDDNLVCQKLVRNCSESPMMVRSVSAPKYGQMERQE